MDPNPDPRDHDAIYVVYMKRAQEALVEFFQTFNGGDMCFKTAPPVSQASD